MPCAIVFEMSSRVSEDCPPPLKRARGSFDVEPCSDDEPASRCCSVRKPQGSVSVGEASLPAGPASYPEVFGWSDHIIQRILGPACHEDRDHRPPKHLRVRLTSSYSGMGMAEIALDCVCSSLAQHNVHVDVVQHSQTEISQACRECLTGQHRFGDLLERLDPSVTEKLERTREKFVSKHAGQPEKLDAMETKFLEAAAKILDEAICRGKFRKEAFCFRCNRDCRWFPQVAGQELWVEIAGNTCTPWSQRGSRKGFLDAAAIPALVWLWSLKYAGGPHIIINENVPSFPSERFFKLAFGNSSVSSALCSPADLGIPTRRRRKYTVVVPDVAKSSFEPPSFGYDVLLKSAFRSLQLRGSVYLQAPKVDVKQFMDDLAAARMLPPRPAGHTYDCMTVMSTGARVRAHQFLEQLHDAGDADRNVDLAQSPAYSKSMAVVPTLVRNSVIFNLNQKRLFLTGELMAAQGLPMYLDRPMINVRPAVWEKLLNQPDSEMRKMLGNSMHLAQIGCCLAVVLCDLCEIA